MDACCEQKADSLTALRARHHRVLVLVLVINAVMFCVEFTAGWVAGSAALLGDSLDMLGDASVYAVTLYALAASARTKAGIAVLKGLVMAVFGLVVLLEAMRRAAGDATPDAGLMLLTGVLALAANAVCFALLYRSRSDDLNMRSVWLCSRNDLISNLSVLLAAWAVHASGSRWPDVAIGVAIALLFLHSARQILVEALIAWRDAAGNRHDIEASRG